MNSTCPDFTWTHGYNSERLSEFVHFRCAVCQPVYLVQFRVPSSAESEFNNYRAVQKLSDLGYFYQRMSEKHYQTLRYPSYLSNV